MQRSGSAEAASHGAAGLAGKTCRKLPLPVGQKNTFHHIAVIKAQSKLCSPVRIALGSLHGAGEKARMLGRQLFAKSLGKVRHLFKGVGAFDEPLVDLLSLERLVQVQGRAYLRRSLGKKGERNACHANILIMAIMTPLMPSPPRRPLETRFMVLSLAFVIFLISAEMM